MLQHEGHRVSRLSCRVVSLKVLLASRKQPPTIRLKSALRTMHPPPPPPPLPSPPSTLPSFQKLFIQAAATCRGSKSRRPIRPEELLAAAKQHPAARLVAGLEVICIKRSRHHHTPPPPPPHPPPQTPTHTLTHPFPPPLSVMLHDVSKLSQSCCRPVSLEGLLAARMQHPEDLHDDICIERNHNQPLPFPLPPFEFSLDDLQMLQYKEDFKLFQLCCRPVSLEGLLSARMQHPEARLVAGHNEIGIERKYNQTTPSLLISISDVPELSQIQVNMFCFHQAVIFGITKHPSAAHADL